MKNTKIVKKKTPQEKHVNKKIKAKEKTAENKSLKRKHVQSNDSEIDVEEDVWDIVPTIRIKIGGKIITLNVPTAPLDNVSFHSESSLQKWKYVFQRRIARERELSK